MFISLFVVCVLATFHVSSSLGTVIYIFVIHILYQAYPSDEKSMAKTQTIVLRHLYLLLGYNQNERGFHVPPQRLRFDCVTLSNIVKSIKYGTLVESETFHYCKILAIIIFFFQKCFQCAHKLKTVRT